MTKEWDSRPWTPENRGRWHAHAHHQEGAPLGVKADYYANSPEEADQVAASLPKGVKARRSTLTSHPDDPSTGRQDFSKPAEHIPSVSVEANLHSNGVNGGINETGLKRYASFRKAVTKQGQDVNWRTPYSNSYETEDEFHSAAGLFNDRREAKEGTTGQPGLTSL